VRRTLIVAVLAFVLGCVVSTTLVTSTKIVKENSIAVVFNDQNMITDVMEPGVHFFVWPGTHVESHEQGPQDPIVANVPATFEDTSDLNVEFLIRFSQEDSVRYLNAVNRETGVQLALTRYDDSLSYTAETSAADRFKFRLESGEVPALQYVATASPTTQVDSDVAAATAYLTKSQQTPKLPIAPSPPRNEAAPNPPVHDDNPWTFKCTSVPVTVTNEDAVLKSLNSISSLMNVKLYPVSVLSFDTVLPCRFPATNSVVATPSTSNPTSGETQNPSGW